MAFKRWKKAPSRKVPVRIWDNNEMKIVGWCINKNIKIGITPDWQHDLSKWQIEISINNNVHLDPNRYDDDNVLDKLYEYYKYYYDKHNK